MFAPQHITLLRKKGEMDLGDYRASCPSCDDLVFIHRPIPFWAGAFYANGCVGKQWVPSCALGRTLSRYRGRVKHLDSLSLSLVNLSWLCIGNAYRSRVSSAMDVGEPKKPRLGNPPLPRFFVPRQRPWPSGHFARLYRRVQP